MELTNGVNLLQKKLLNETYFNSAIGESYNARFENTVDCDFTSEGLSEKAKIYIEDAVWNLGSNGSQKKYGTILATDFYKLERSNTIGKICTSGTLCTDKVTRTVAWTGRIGLLYPSDYAYATSGTPAMNRTTCLENVLTNWRNSDLLDCINTNWIQNFNHVLWTITPGTNATDAIDVFYIAEVGGVFDGDAYHNFYLNPVFYANSNTKIISGLGTKDHPYKLSLN